MERQHTENLFRRYKGQLVNIKTVSGDLYKGHVGEITSDYAALNDRDSAGQTQTFVFFDAMESLVVAGDSSGK